MKKKFVIAIASIAILSGLVIGGVTANQGSADDPTAPDLMPQVTAQQTQIDNHEGRITNTEGDVRDLQNRTNTPPSTTRVEVPVAQPTPPVPAPTPQPTPVTVIAFEQIPVVNSENVDCKLTYSDGTLKQWLWKTVEYNQGTKITRTSGLCDSSVIGKQKN